MRPLVAVLRRAVIYAGTVAFALAGCKKEPPPQEPPTAEAKALAARMVGKIYEKDGYAYPLPYRLFVPEGYDAKRRYPLILYLHGAGGWGNDNVRHLNEDVAQLTSGMVQGIEPSFVLAPHCPAGDQWVNGAHAVPFTNYVQASVPESDAAKQVLKVLEEVQGGYSIDAARLYVTGPSMGGAGSWDYITRYPGLFAAAVTVNGVNDPSRASVIAKLPIWAFHGEKDEVAPVKNTRSMVQALKKLGSPVKYTELAGEGHGCNAAAYGNPEVWRWLLAQRLGS